MKNVKFMLGAFLGAMLLTSAAYAGEGKTGENVTKNKVDVLREQFANALSEVANENQGEVFVLFTVDKQKGVEILDVKGSDKNLATKVKSQLSGTRFYIPSSLKGKYLVKVKFTNSYDAAPEVSNEKVKTDMLRSEISNQLAKISAIPGESVKVNFSVKNNAFILKGVDSKNEKLAKDVKQALSGASLDVPDNVAGNYEVKVRF